MNPAPTPAQPVRAPESDFLTDPQAAEYCCLSLHTLRRMRRLDRDRLLAGEPLDGPLWCQKRRSIWYRKIDLDNYLKIARPRADEIYRPQAVTEAVD